VRGESCGRVGAATGWVHVRDGNKISALGQAAWASRRVLALNVRALIAPLEKCYYMNLNIIKDRLRRCLVHLVALKSSPFVAKPITK
jgi:hypothetical protein